MGSAYLTSLLTGTAFLIVGMLGLHLSIIDASSLTGGCAILSGVLTHEGVRGLLMRIWHGN